ncbi:MAG: NHLP bacteriocin export ABC transporter permease/ATPase subunit [Oscillospiraceae bacterium]|nr:NHLP bacteriocin export ABC transporter permease/ATPase subunit [Oscillospiraceae bacterium]
MKQENDILYLRGSDSLLTEDPENAYKVTDGVALVYVVRVTNGAAGRRSLVCEAHAGDFIPSLCFRDELYNNWRFCISALGAAQLRVIPGGCTSVLKRRFAEAAGVRHLEREGFENGFSDLYERSTVSEDAYLHKTLQDRQGTVRQNMSLIYRSFSGDKQADMSGMSDDLLYRAAAFACAKCGIQPAPQEKIIECCGREYGIADIARVSHFACREVVLEEKWHRRDMGVLIVFIDGKPMVCVPRGACSYNIYSMEDGSCRKLTASVAAGVEPKAVTICRPFPEDSMTMRGLAKWCLGSVRVQDIVRLAVMAVLGALIGVLTPALNQMIFDELVPLGDIPAVVQICALVGSFLLANILFSAVKGMSSFRFSSRIRFECQNAAYDRLFSLPESFLRKYESADLAQRAMGVGEAVSVAASEAAGSVVVAISLAAYFVKMAQFSPGLAGISLLMTVVYAGVVLLISGLSLKYERDTARLNGEAASKLYQIISGIAKIRIAGVEERALHEYLRPFSQLRRSAQKSERLALVGRTVGVVSDSLFLIVLYIAAAKSGMELTAGAFMGFISAFGAFSAAAMQLTDSAVGVISLRPLLARIEPILSAKPELNSGMETPGELSGGIEISSVTFRYDDNSPNVLDGISLNIRPGEYIGVVGASGCGKSTLMKLMLGFETPVSGKIYYDGKDIESLDKRELRKKFGVVLQDGKLISGSIFENITITAPRATVEEVNEATAAVGLKEDIDQMPMGLHTVLSEDCGTISGGQQQRILIARAIISKPSILFFDEATSALDNITQSMVCSSLEKLNATRIVIAHRLSTIMKCDRIIVLDGGRIAEQGTFDELMEAGGLFSRLASRQM